MRPVLFSPGLALAALLGMPLALAQDFGAASSDEVFAESLRQQRVQLQRERQALSAAFKAQALDCQARFFVNACSREVALREREALVPLRRREQVLEQAERQRRLDAALARAAARQQEQSERVPAETEAQATARVAQELKAREQERARREAEAAARADQQRARAAETERRRLERDEAVRQRPDRPALPDPTAGP